MPVFGVRDGVDLDNLDVTSDAEIDAMLNRVRKGRGPLDPGPMYELRANSVWLYTRPDFAKLHLRVLDAWRNSNLKGIISASSFANMHTYINQGWEIGVENCMRGLQRRGVTKAQVMELVMHAQLSAGIRGLEVVYRSVGILLGDYVEHQVDPDWPDGWAPDMAAFKCGLDPSTKECTPADKKAIESWYEKNLGYVPARVGFLARTQPAFLKATRARWEGAFRGALPKQMMPYLSMRHNTVIGNEDGLREAVLLAKAWGVTDDYIIHTVTASAYYFTGEEMLEMASRVLDKAL
jgi:hypothetical protein